MPREKNRFGLRVILVLIAVILQGFGVFWLTNLDFGTDPCTVMNLGISERIGLSYGNTIFIYNCILFIVVLLFGRREIGIGTLANMVLVGYSADFFSWLFFKILPVGFFDDFKTRAIILMPALIEFVIAAATYMAVDLGQSPYDAVPAIITRGIQKKHKEVKFTVVRVAWDISMAFMGFLLGSTVGVVTVLICFGLGPMITFIKNFLKRKLDFE